MGSCSPGAHSIRNLSCSLAQVSSVVGPRSVWGLWSLHLPHGPFRGLISTLG